MKLIVIFKVALTAKTFLAIKITIFVSYLATPMATTGLD